MFEKLAIRRTLKKLNSQFEDATLNLAYMDQDFHLPAYSKELYLLNCKKLSKIVSDLLKTKESLVELIERISNTYINVESCEKLAKISEEIQLLKKSANYCRFKLEEKEGRFEPKPTFDTWKQKIKLNGEETEVPFAKRIEAKKSQENTNMKTSVLEFDKFCSDIEANISSIISSKTNTSTL